MHLITSANLHSSTHSCHFLLSSSLALRTKSITPKRKQPVKPVEGTHYFSFKGVTYMVPVASLPSKPTASVNTVSPPTSDNSHMIPIQAGVRRCLYQESLCPSHRCPIRGLPKGITRTILAISGRSPCSWPSYCMNQVA